MFWKNTSFLNHNLILHKNSLCRVTTNGPNKIFYNVIAFPKYKVNGNSFVKYKVTENNHMARFTSTVPNLRIKVISRNELSAPVLIKYLTDKLLISGKREFRNSVVLLQDNVIMHASNQVKKVVYDDNEDTRQIFNLFPAPESELHNVNSELSTLTQKELKVTPDYKLLTEGGKEMWSCAYHALWPKEIKFLATSQTKKNTSHKFQNCFSVLPILCNNTHNITNSKFHARLLSTKADRGIKNDKEEIVAEKILEQDSDLHYDSPTYNTSNTIKEVYYNDNNEIRQTLKLFPTPKNILHNVYDVVSRESNKKQLKITPIYKSVKDENASKWLCMYHVKWPEEIKFLAKDVKKSVASHKAALAALTWLRNNDKISSKGLPLLYEKSEVKQLAGKGIPICLDENTIENMGKIIDIHQNNIEPHTISSELNTSEDGSIEHSAISEEPNDINLKQVTVQPFLGLEYYSAKEKVELPIAAYKEKFIEMLNNNQVLIVKGEPGCGKSTRIPQYVLEAWSKQLGSLQQKGRIVVTQPRRIAAISLAERVAAERDELVGKIVGYQVRLKSNFSPPTGRILYCTTGILLRRLQSDPDLLDFTHVILDEAHERDVNTDLLMNLLRSAIKRNPELKLIIMSATIDTDMFSKYYEGAPVMEIPGFTYPVKQNFLESCKKIDISKTLKMCESNVPVVIHEDVVKVIKFIHDTKREGAILCFLPGWEDISKIGRMLPERQDIVVYYLHSRLQDDEQWKIFSNPPPGVRKIILATNIAETSVTINDVVYVVDTGIQKQLYFDVEKGVNCIDNYWVSKASSTQRKGRAGRCQPGESYHLYPYAKYKSFRDYSLPEIKCMSLTKIVLNSKIFSNNMNALKFMGQLPTPPEENATLKAVEELKELELLDDNENLTSLGKTLAEFQLEPKLAKAMVNAVVYKCTTPIVDIVTLFSSETEFFISGMLHKEEVKSVKQQFCQTSDHLAMMRVFEKWLEYSEEGEFHRMRQFCNDANLVPNKMKTIEKLRTIHFDYLYNGLHNVIPISDDFSNSDELVKAVLFSGVGTILQYRDWDIVKSVLKKNVNVFLTRNNHRATITTESVNFRRKTYPTDFLLYINETRSNIRRTTLVRECSLIPKISVLLFANKDLVIKNISQEDFSPKIDSPDQVKLVIENTKIEFVCDRMQAEMLINCKNAIMAGYRYYIRQLTDTGKYNRKVNSSWDNILNTINDILSKNAV